MSRFSAILALVLLAVGCAGGTTSTSDRTYVVTMRDNEFEPSSFSAERGETVTFRFINRGSVEHDAFIGREAEQEAHEEEMSEADDGGHGGHGNGDWVTVEPGASEELDFTFTRRGTVLIGCHQPGHYEDGMTAKVKVT